MELSGFGVHAKISFHSGPAPPPSPGEVLGAFLKEFSEAKLRTDCFHGAFVPAAVVAAAAASAAAAAACAAPKVGNSGPARCSDGKTGGKPKIGRHPPNKPTIQRLVPPTWGAEGNVHMSHPREGNPPCFHLLQNGKLCPECPLSIWQPWHLVVTDFSRAWVHANL